MVTRGSWVTPHTMEAWVPLMTLWSWGGLVMRVRAARRQGHRVVRRGADAEKQVRGRCVGKSSSGTRAHVAEGHGQGKADTACGRLYHGGHPEC